MHLVGSLVVKFKRFFPIMPEITVARLADDTSGYSRTNGVKNQSITKPISLDETSGEVVVRKATGKSKIRKGQSDEEYQNQLHQYFEVEKGPKRTEIGWMDTADYKTVIKDSENSLQLKGTRQKLSGFCERLYYQRKYAECASLCDELLPKYEPFNKKNKIKREIEELEYMAKRSKDLLEVNQLSETINQTSM